MNQIYYVGYDAVHSSDFKYDIPEGFHCYLLILTTTPVLIRVQGRILEYPAHTAILYPPNHEIWYAANGESYGNNWIRFYSDESFVTNFPQQAVPFPVSDPEYCHNLFQLLTWETAQIVSSIRYPHSTGKTTQRRETNLNQMKVDTNQSNLIISQLLRILFNQLHNNIIDKINTNYDYELLALRRQVASNPQLQWKIKDMANELHISTGYLQLLYKQKFGISCMDDVINFRLFKARDLLTYTTERIAEIAEECGYNDTEHFCRQFHKNIGLTPGQFRKKTCK